MPHTIDADHVNFYQIGFPCRGERGIARLAGDALMRADPTTLAKAYQLTEYVSETVQSAKIDRGLPTRTWLTLEVIQVQKADRDGKRPREMSLPINGARFTE